MESGAERKCETVFHMGHPALHTAVLGKHIVGANNVRPELLRQACGLPPPLEEEALRNPLIEEMPERAEESFVPLEKGDVSVS